MPTADELLYDLEYYIYHQGYGPTNETLGKFIRELFGQIGRAASEDCHGGTQVLEHTAPDQPHRSKTTVAAQCFRTLLNMKRTASVRSSNSA